MKWFRRRPNAAESALPRQRIAIFTNENGEECVSVGLKVFLRRGTTAEWQAANPVLLPREVVYAIDTGKLKVGDGSSTWSELEER